MHFTEKKEQYNPSGVSTLGDQAVLLQITGLGDPQAEQAVLKALRHRYVPNEYRFTVDASDGEVDALAFEQQLKAAINKAKNQRVLLLISHFKPFEKDASLSFLRLLEESGLAFSILDFPGFRVEALRAMIELYERRKKSRSAMRASETHTNRTTEHLNDPVQQEKTRRRQGQRVFWDTNTRLALSKLGTLQAIDSYTLQETADWLERQGVATPRGKAHSPKSVSRLLERLAELAVWFRPEWAWEDRLATLNGTQAAYSNSIQDIAEDSQENRVAPPTKKVTDAPVQRKNQEQLPAVIQKKDTRLSSLVTGNNLELIRKEELRQPYVHVHDKKKHLPLKWPKPNRAHGNLYLDFADLIVLEFSKPLSGVHILIHGANQKDAAVRYDQVLSTDEEGRIIIDIRRDTYLLPGLHYMELRVEEYEYLGKKFTILEELNPAGRKNSSDLPIS